VQIERLQKDFGEYVYTLTGATRPRNPDAGGERRGSNWLRIDSSRKWQKTADGFRDKQR
jgi:hypothetical protein